MTFGSVINNMTPYVISIVMILYGALLIHHSNSIIRNKIASSEALAQAIKTTADQGGDFSNLPTTVTDIPGCKASENILLAQGVAIIITLLGVLTLSATLYSKHPGIKQKLNYLGDVHTKYGGHPYAKYAKMLLVLGFAIYFLVDMESHKTCTDGNVGGEGLLLAANITIVSLIGLYLLYKLTLIIMGKKNS